MIELINLLEEMRKSSNTTYQLTIISESHVSICLSRDHKKGELILTDLEYFLFPISKDRKVNINKLKEWIKNN